MTGLIDIFPLLVLVLVVVGMFAVWRLAKRYSLGSVEGGPWEYDLPEHRGQLSIPWELEQVDRQLALLDTQSPLVPLLNQMIQASPLDSRSYRLGQRPTKAQIDRVVTDLERAIGMRSQ